MDRRDLKTSADVACGGDIAHFLQQYGDRLVVIAERAKAADPGAPDFVSERDVVDLEVMVSEIPALINYARNLRARKEGKNG